MPYGQRLRMRPIRGAGLCLPRYTGSRRVFSGAAPPRPSNWLAQTPPAGAPVTGTPEPGGLDWYSVTSLLRRVTESREVVGADIVELAPLEGTQVSEFVAARLGAKILTYHRYC